MAHQVQPRTPVDERLPDGSYLSHLHEVVGNHRRKSDVLVRVIEYTVDDRGRRKADPPYRLLSTILDPQAAPAQELPAQELAALYAERWEFESVLDELKTHQRGPRAVLRSKTPEGVRRGLFGFERGRPVVSRDGFLRLRAGF